MITKVEEIKLLAQCVLADNRDAFGRLVDAYRPDIMRFFLNLTLGDGALSDDLAQETFIKAYLSIRSFKGLAQFRTWLYRIAYNEYYSWLRKRHEDRIDEENMPAESMLDERSNGIREAQIDVQIAMQSLSRQQRAVVTLFYIEDQPIKKISEITGMPAGTVKSHISRAKAKLTQLLEKNKEYEKSNQ